MQEVAASSPFKLRRGRHGAHYFDRTSGLNVLLDELAFDPQLWHSAPRYVSVALTNACELSCPFCYAPKRPARLCPDQVMAWAGELDANGTFGIGFGGGEPTAHPEFVSICRSIAEETALAVSFTTHGHRFTAALADDLRGNVHFIRVSVDGVGATYERIRGRPFASLTEQIKLIESTAPFGINVVVTEETVDELDACLAWAEAAGARELLLLAEQPANGRPGLPPVVHRQMTEWIVEARPGIRLAVGASDAEAEMGLADPFGREPPLEAHAHVDASAYLRPDAYSTSGVPIGSSIMDAVHNLGQEL